MRTWMGKAISTVRIIDITALAGYLSWLEGRPNTPDCEFDPWSGHTEEATKERMDAQRGKLLLLSLSLSLVFHSLFLKSINQFF